MALDWKGVLDRLYNTFNKNNQKASADFVTPQNAKKQDDLVKDMITGKEIVLNKPASNRFTFDKSLAPTDQKEYKNWSPQNSRELSPEGFIQSTQIAEQREEPGKKDARLYEASIPSTALKKVSYDPKTEDLTVQFNGNKTKYWYPNVPTSEVIGLMKAPSKGHYFLENIHDQYTLNPGHEPSQNKFVNQTKGGTYKDQRRLNTVQKQLEATVPMQAQARLKRSGNNATFVSNKI